MKFKWQPGTGYRLKGAKKIGENFLSYAMQIFFIFSRALRQSITMKNIQGNLNGMTIKRQMKTTICNLTIIVLATQIELGYPFAKSSRFEPKVHV